MSKYSPRNDFVVVKTVPIGAHESGLIMPQTSIEGNENIVEAIGPKVEGLKVGDKVLMTGQENVDWAFLPEAGNLRVVREGNILLIYNTEEEVKAS